MEITHYTEAGSRTLGLYAVADGMGGESSGQVASRKVTETLALEVNRLVLAARPSFSGGPTDYQSILLAAVQQANRDVYNARQQAGNRMGSTLVAALLIGFQAHIANVGDSRAYLVTTDKIDRLTKDHSLVQALLDRHVISEAERRAHPQRNYITRSMGDKPHVDVDLVSIRLEPGQYLLLCCDGLWEMVQDDEIQRTVVRSSNPQEACRQLINAANAHGGDDNITCVLVRVEDADVGAQ
jgi:serine/threonine protein phosphatase PrpC